MQSWRVACVLIVLAACGDGGDEPTFVGTWRLADGSTSDSTCITPDQTSLGGLDFNVSTSSSSPLAMTTIQGTSSIWPPFNCFDLDKLDLAGNTATTRSSPCSAQDGASGQGTWTVTVDPYAVTLVLEGDSMTVMGSMTLSNLHNSGMSCTDTLTATATRVVPQ